ncbi:MAG: hypothetical protein A2289_03105 [Deltaproteobacteria bacterium RIFOXYA12_FULL_58_15]|nr:MAG: hypothetical protein A2289_03105 [Deltaproteobacteria bacterium RIFOXYA12_FULL_58_15]OGR07678.1 MAG: hypothetical protein A2341_06600 [Deltaproteobacteria bacterium RIFOXYB12_FULL_58_9]
MTFLEAAEAGGTGEKSSTLWPLPGGQDAYFESLLAFIDKIAADTPTVESVLCSATKASNYSATVQRRTYSGC